MNFQKRTAALFLSSNSIHLFEIILLQHQTDLMMDVFLSWSALNPLLAKLFSLNLLSPQPFYYW